MGFPSDSAGKESACNAGDLGSIPGLGRPPGEGTGYPLHSCLENPMDASMGSNRVGHNWATFPFDLEYTAVFGELTINHDFGLSIKRVSGTHLKQWQRKALCLPSGNPRAIEPLCPHRVQSLKGLHEPSHWWTRPRAPDLGHSPHSILLVYSASQSPFALLSYVSALAPSTSPETLASLKHVHSPSWLRCLREMLRKVCPSGRVPTGNIRRHTWLTPRSSRLAERQRGFWGGTGGKEPTCQCRSLKRCRFDPWVGKIPWRGSWQPAPVLFPGESHGQRNLAGYGPWGHPESDTTKAT